jgi:UDP-N-acetylglucosamine:LPS N-acetylglucosamine transferase
VQILPFDPNLTARFARSRLIVCQAGYNTIAEVTALGVPVVCIPGQRDADDQFERAGLVAGLHPQVQVCAEAQVQAMAAMMVRGLAMNRRRGIQSPRGAEVAAQHLLDALETIEGRS